MKYQPSKVISLKKSAEHNEKWLQEIIASSPEILGLGEISLLATERRQLNGGRLDLLFEDEASNVRYTVELQLGATDEAHIIRTIEYWDNERNRNPQIEHVAVIVAENVTTRFLNVMALFNKSIPLIAIQLSANQVGDVITLNFIKVMDLSLTYGNDEEVSSSETADRTSWEKRSTPEILKIADEVLSIIHEIFGDNSYQLNYNRHYIGLAIGGVANNFASFKPRKKNLILQFRANRTQELDDIIEQNFDVLAYDAQWRLYQLRINAQDLIDNRKIIKDLLRVAAQRPELTDGN